MEFGFISLRGLNYPVFLCVSGLHESLGTSFCCCRSTFNVTTQKQGKVVLWLDECWVVERIERHDSQRGVCLSQSSVSDWGYCSTRDWQLGRRAFGSFLISLSRWRCPLGLGNSCYSISAERLMAVMRMKSKLSTEPVFFFHSTPLWVFTNCH